MAARSLTIGLLLKEADREDKLRRRRQAAAIRQIGTNLIHRDAALISQYRLNGELIDLLERELTPLLPIVNRGISNRIKILATLSFLGTGSYQKAVGEGVGTHLSQASTSRAIHAVVDALNDPHLIKKYIKFPTTVEERSILQEKFYQKYKIPGVVGCIDGTLVAMVRPRDHEEWYYCRKGYHARNALITNDSDLNILHVDVKFGGATHDSFVFQSSDMKRHLEQLTNTGEALYLLGDSGFPQRPYIMTPCSSPNEGSPEEYYNQIHCTARNTAERTIGLLKGRFRCLLGHRVLHYDPSMVAKIIIGCCVLHNLCNRAGFPAPSTEMDLLNQEQPVQEVPDIGLPRDDDVDSGRRARRRLIERLWRARQSNRGTVL